MNVLGGKIDAYYHVRPMSPSTFCLCGGIGSLVMGLLFVLFSKAIGAGFCRYGKWTWKGHEDDLAGKIRQKLQREFPAFSPYDEATAPKKIRLLGVVFLVQAVVFFILSAVTWNLA
jgi:hypothetical protein